MSWFFFPGFFILLPSFLKILVSLGLLIFLLVTVVIIFTKRLVLSLKITLLKFYFGTMWFLPYISTLLLVPILKLGSYFLKNFDQGWLEDYSGQYIYLKISSSSIKIDFFNNLNIKSYLLIFFFLITLIFLLI